MKKYKVTYYLSNREWTEIFTEGPLKNFERRIKNGTAEERLLCIEEIEEGKSKENNENLKLLNQVRMVAQTIQNESFKREYKNIITPILEKYKEHICNDTEMRHRVYDAIKKINHLAETYLYVPNDINNGTIPYRSIADYSDHTRLMETYMITKKILQTEGGGYCDRTKEKRKG